MHSTDSKTVDARLSLISRPKEAASPAAQPRENLTVARSPKSLEARLIMRLLTRLGNLPLRVILPDGEVLSSGNAPAVGTLTFRDRRTIWTLAVDPLFQFSEAYSDGRIDVDGDLAECLTVIFRQMGLRENASFGERLMTRLRRPNGTTLHAAKQNIHHHYDIGNDFYRLWLDRQMVYTCAYYRQPHFTLEEAQVAKMDHVCRKLRLKPGMQVLEAGCGWGALALHMARRYGVRVIACNISREQIAWARERSQREGLDELVEFIEDDWRNCTGKYDAFVSVGMLEHVGVKNYQQLGKSIDDCLKPEGMGLIHTIGQNRPRPFNPWIERRIFPGAYPPTLKQMMEIFEPAEFSILDVENLRLHYAQTLRHWLERFENEVEQVRSQHGERFVRMWRAYLAGSVAAFDSGYLQLFQVVFAKNTSNNIPRTREHLYDTPQSRIQKVIKCGFESLTPPDSGHTERGQGIQSE
jgi:cyclopropane-fatty-acyl-phospholipid synthase